MQTPKQILTNFLDDLASKSQAIQPDPEVREKIIDDHLASAYPNTGKFVIINLNDMDYMKDEKGNINYYDTFTEAALTCGIYEFDDVWIMELKYNYREDR